jgi:putative glutamine amidotransferase
MLPKPLIGLTTTRSRRSTKHPTFVVNKPYKESITNAGGLYELVPMDLSTDDLDALLPSLDGILFTGGYDIDPQRYGHGPHPKVDGVDVDRDQIEFYLVHQVVKLGKPFFGICRGIQVINVALGGSLYEDLPEQFEVDVHHDNHDLPRNHLAHQVNVEPTSSLAGILASNQPQVNSLHHQGVRGLAQDVHPIAYATDGLVEAFELPSHPFSLAVQWHPEELQEHEDMRRLFKAFIQACQSGSSV